MRKACETCGQRLSIPARGRSPSFCSNRCRQAAHRARSRSAFPPELRAAKRWVRADGKRPIQVDGSPASSTDSDTWSTFKAVQSGAGDGFGFMLGDGFGVIDLDHCLDADGSLSDLASRVLRLNPDAFVECSVSGEGLHVWGFRSEGRGFRGSGVEVYSKSRFIRCGTVHRRGVLAELNVEVVQ